MWKNIEKDMTEIAYATITKISTSLELEDTRPVFILFISNKR